MKEKNKNKMKMLEAEVHYYKEWKVESLLKASNTVLILSKILNIDIEDCNKYSEV